MHATVDQYALPEELIEEVISLVDLGLGARHLHQLTSVQQKMLRDLAARAKTVGEVIYQASQRPGASALIHSHPGWNDLRERSGQCLRSFELDVGSIESELSA